MKKELLFTFSALISYDFLQHQKNRFRADSRKKADEYHLYHV